MLALLPLLLAAPPAKFDGHTLELYAVAWSAAGDKLASTANDGTIRVWPTAGGPPVVIKTGTGSRCVALSPDGKLVAGRFETGARLWDATTGAVVAHLDRKATSADNTVRRVAFSPDGKRLAVGHEYGRVRVWDVATQAPVAEFARPGKVGDPSYIVTALVFSPDGKWLAVGSQRGLAVWDVAAGTFTALGAETAHTTSVTFTPDGTRLLVNETDRVGYFRVWKVADWTNPLTTDHKDTPERFLSGVRAVSDTVGVGVNGRRQFELFDLAAGRPTGETVSTPYQDSPGGYAVRPDGKAVAHYFGGNLYTVHVTPLPAAK